MFCFEIPWTCFWIHASGNSAFVLLHWHSLCVWDQYKPNVENEFLDMDVDLGELPLPLWNALEELGCLWDDEEPEASAEPWNLGRNTRRQWCWRGALAVPSLDYTIGAGLHSCSLCCCCICEMDLFLISIIQHLVLVWTQCILFRKLWNLLGGVFFKQLKTIKWEI